MLKPGLSFTSQTTVSEQLTAKAMGSGDLEVFATPALVALMENAAMNAVKLYLEADCTTVGTLINVAHTKATPQGQTVKATATLREVDGRKLLFDLAAEDSNGVVGQGTHERFVVDVERFMSKLR